MTKTWNELLQEIGSTQDQVDDACSSNLRSLSSTPLVFLNLFNSLPPKKVKKIFIDRIEKETD